MHKNNSIGEKLVELLSPIVDLSYIQAEVSKFPYCAYDMESLAPVKDKQGIRAFNASVSIYVVTKTESQADEMKNKIIGALKREKYWDFSLQNITAATDQGHWSYRLEYSITQIV